MCEAYYHFLWLCARCLCCVCPSRRTRHPIARPRAHLPPVRGHPGRACAVTASDDEASLGRVWDHRKLLERGFLLCTASIYHYNNTYADLDMCCARILRARALLGTQLTIRPKFRGYSRRPRSVSGARLGPEKLFTLGLLLRPASLYHIH